LDRASGTGRRLVTSVVEGAAVKETRGNTPPLLTQCMVRPCVARGFHRSVGLVLHQCIRPRIGACSAPGHHGYQRACVLISGQASNGPNGSPGLAGAGKTDPPFRFILSQTSAGKRGLCHCSLLMGQFLCSCREAVPSSRPAGCAGHRAQVKHYFTAFSLSSSRFLCSTWTPARSCGRDDASEGSSLSRHEKLAPQPCIRWVAATRIMMHACASAARLRGGGPILNGGTKAMAWHGTPPPRTVIARLSRARD
jgi:hypothetical protein